MSDYDETELVAGGTDFESALVTDIIDNKSIRAVIKHKINESYFFDTQAKAAFIYLMSWFNNPAYGDTPSWESFQHSFADFQPNRVEDSTIALCDKLREAKLYDDLASVIREVSDQAMGDPKGAYDTIRARVASMHTAHTVDESSDIRSRLEDLRTEYLQMKSGGTGLKGHPYPWPALNESTLGLQDQQLVFIYGRPKSKKTWSALCILQHLHSIGLRPVIFSQEMSDIEIARRWVALASNVDYGQYLRGQLPPNAERDFLDDLEAFAEQPPVIIDYISARGADAVMEMSAKIDEYKANVVLIDAFYTLGEDWKELATVMSGTKGLCKTKRIPIIGTTQANRSGKQKKNAEEGADDFAYADAFAQWADLGLRCSCDIEDKRQQQVTIATAVQREGVAVTFSINARLAEDMTQKKIIKFGNDDDADEAIDQAMYDGKSDNPMEAEEPSPNTKPSSEVAKPSGVQAKPRLVSVPAPKRLVLPAKPKAVTV